MRALLQEEDSDKLLRSPAPSFASASPFDSSLVLTVLVLLTILFFMAFFSLYIRRLSSASSSGDPVSEAGNSSPRLKRGEVDVSTVQSLPNILYGGKLKTSRECSICLTEFEERETVKVIPYCRHGFHPVSIETWLPSHVSCPSCRSTQLFPAVDEVRTGTG